MRTLAPAELAALLYDWDFWARPEQKLPEGDWVYWLILAGRGAGKTRSGAEAVRHWVFRDNLKFVNLIAATESDINNVMIYGESGIMAVCAPFERPRYVADKHKLYWPNGAVSLTFSAEKPDRLRGPQHEALWCDELAAWRFPDAFDQAQMGLRLGTHPRCVITTTPRPTKVIKDLVADPATIRSGGSTYANRANLAKGFFDKIIRRYRGTRLERQEIYAEIIDSVEGALWTRETLDRSRVTNRQPWELAKECERIVVAIDPAMTSGEDADETGLIVAGLGQGRSCAYVLEDESGQYTPQGKDGWAARAIRLYRKYRANLIVAEINQGGEMVAATIQALDPNIPVKTVHAVKGKYLRAEPVSMLYDQDRVRHVGVFAKLEDQMCTFTPDLERTKGNSPDRMDAAVYALTELMVADDGTSIIEFGRREVEAIVAEKAKAHAPPGPAGFVAMIPPPGVSTAYGVGGAKYDLRPDGFVWVDAKDEKPLMRAGFKPAGKMENVA